jgi:hypothetical protein
VAALISEASRLNALRRSMMAASSMVAGFTTRLVEQKDASTKSEGVVVTPHDCGTTASSFASGLFGKDWRSSCISETPLDRKRAGLEVVAEYQA